MYLMNRIRGMVEIGYIIDDSVLNASDALYYGIGQRGSGPENSGNRYMEVAK